MRRWYVFSVLAATGGLLLALGSHIATLSGFSQPFGPNVCVLFLGAGILQFPTMAAADSSCSSENPTWTQTIEGCPRWMRGALYAIWGYLILNIIWAPPSHQVSATGGIPITSVLESSAFAMAFYAVQAAVIYSAMVRESELGDDRARKIRPGNGG